MIKSTRFYKISSNSTSLLRHNDKQMGSPTNTRLNHGRYTVFLSLVALILKDIITAEDSIIGDEVVPAIAHDPANCLNTKRIRISAITVLRTPSFPSI